MRGATKRGKVQLISNRNIPELTDPSTFFQDSTNSHSSSSHSLSLYCSPNHLFSSWNQSCSHRLRINGQIEMATGILPQQNAVFPRSHVGFDSITQQIEKKLLKRGFQFNVICVGMFTVLLATVTRILT